MKYFLLALLIVFAAFPSGAEEGALIPQKPGTYEADKVFGQTERQNLGKALDLQTDAAFRAMSAPDLANAYFSECRAYPVAADYAEAQELFCGCIAAHMADSMPAGEIRVALRPSKDGPREETEAARDNFIMKAYLPCVETPLRDLFFKNCVVSKSGAGKLCGCVADRTARKMAEVLPKNVKPAVERQSAGMANIEEFFLAMMENKGTGLKTRYYTTLCGREVNTHQFVKPMK